MPKTPKQAGRTPRPQAQFPSQVVSANVRSLRALRGVSQDDLAAWMSLSQHGWSRATTSEIERGERNVTVDELCSLALLLAVSPGELLDPDRLSVNLDLGSPGPLPRPLASAWTRGRLNLHLEGEPGAWKYAFEQDFDDLSQMFQQLRQLQQGTKGGDQR